MLLQRLSTYRSAHLLLRYYSTSHPEHLLLKAAQSQLTSPKTSDDNIENAKRLKALEPLRAVLKQLEDNTELMQSLEMMASDKDVDMASLAEQDLEDAKSTRSGLLKSLTSALLPPSPHSNLSAILELKAGVGGSEASLFVGDLLRMYEKYAVIKGWKAEIMEQSIVGDGFRDVILQIEGEGVYGKLHNEKGVHRVQRVPATETQGRVHTSTASVIVLPLVEENDTSDILDEKDVKADVMRAGGAGGQHVNRTESAVRLTHLPTGITVTIQETRSQHKNRTKAFAILRSRLLEKRLKEDQESARKQRKAQVSTLHRSEKVRTYNYAQDRVTDHRLGKSIMNIEKVMEGELDSFVDELGVMENDERLEALLST